MVVAASVVPREFWVELKVNINIGGVITRIVKSTDAIIEIVDGVEVVVTTPSSSRRVPWHNVDMIVTLLGK